MKRVFPFHLSILALAVFLSGCGSSMKNTVQTTGTMATLQTGDALNDQIVKFELTISSITLTGTGGTANTSNLLSGPAEVEFTHEAGAFEPLSLAHVPPGTYSGATMTVSNPEVVAIIGGVPTKLTATLSSATVNIAFSPNVTVGSSPIFINFDIDLPNSVTINGTNATVTPTFKVSTSTVAPNENGEDDHDGEIDDVHGSITNITAPDFTIQTRETTITFATDANTKFSGGITQLSDLKTGEVVEVDGVTQPDGTKLAVKVELEEGQNGEEMEGIVSSVTGNPATGITIVHQLDSTGSSTPPVTVNVQITANTQFLIRLDRLGLNLSIPVVFDASHIGNGQRVEVNSSSTGTPLVADKIKLREQALIGTVSNLNGNTFTLTVSPTSAFATLSGVSTVSVTMLGNADEAAPLMNGATVRVRGLVFVNGTTYSMIGARDDDNN
jgi:Tfp pilus assembly protein FimT